MNKTEHSILEDMCNLLKDMMALEDDLSSAGEYHRLQQEIEEKAMELILFGTSHTEDELIEFLDSDLWGL